MSPVSSVSPPAPATGPDAPGERPGRGEPAARRALAGAAVLAGLGGLAWANALGTPFVFDDEVSVVRNDSIRRLWPPWAALWAPERRVMAGRPLANLSLAVNYALGGLDPRGYHAVSLALHVGAGMLLLGVLRRTLPHARLSPAVRAVAPALALVVAAVWLVHPLQTDAVTYITQRNEVLMGFCYLLTLYAAIRAWDGGAAWTALAVLACAAGMASKEPMVSAPAMVVLWDRTFVVPTFAGAWRRRRALYVGLAATWSILAALLVFTPRTETIGFGNEIGPWAYLSTEAGVLVRYLGLALWPDALSIDHGVWVAHGVRAVVVPGLVVLALLAGTAWALVRRRPVGFLGAWFFGILAPTSSFVPIVTEVMAERRMYLPLAAVATLVIVGVARVLGDRRRVALALAAATVATLTVATIRRNRVFASEESVLADAVAKRPDNFRARTNLASVLIDGGRLDEATAQLTEAIALEPRFALAHYDLGTVLLDQERWDEAVAQLVQAMRLDPTNPDAHLNLGTALLSLGRVGEAREEYAAGVRLAPSSAAAHNNLGMVLLRQGDVDGALRELGAAVDLDPTQAEFRAHLDEARARAGAR